MAIKVSIVIMTMDTRPTRTNKPTKASISVYVRIEESSFLFGDEWKTKNELTWNGLGIDKEREPRDDDKQETGNVGLNQVVVNLSGQVDAQYHPRVTFSVVVRGVRALEDDLALELVQADVGIDIRRDRIPLKLNLVRRVAETLEFDFADLLVHGIMVKIHVTSHIVIDPRGVPVKRH